MEFLRGVGGGIQNAAQTVGGALNAPNAPGEPSVLGLLAQQPEHILRGLIQAPGAFIDYGLGRFAEPGTMNTLRNIQSASGLAELLGTRPGALQIPRVSGLTGLPEDYQIPGNLRTPQEEYQIAQAEELRRRTALLNNPELFASMFGGGGRLRGWKFNPLTGQYQLDYTTEPYVRPEGQGPNPPRLDVPEPPPPPPPRTKDRRLDVPPARGEVPPAPEPPADRSIRGRRGLVPGHSYDATDAYTGEKFEFIPGKDGVTGGGSNGKSYYYDVQNDKFLPYERQRTGPPATEPPPRVTQEGPPTSTTTTTVPAPPTTVPTTVPPATTTTTVPTTGGTTPTLRQNFTRDDVLNLPFQGAGGPPAAATPPAGTQAQPPAGTAQDRALDDDERVLGVPPPEGTVGYPPPAPAPPAGAQAGAAIGGALARAPGAPERALVPATTRALTRVAEGARTLLSPAEAQAAEGGPPPEVRPAVTPTPAQVAAFGDAAMHYRPLREYIQRHPELTDSTSMLFNSNIQGMVADWQTLRSVTEAKLKKAGEMGAADRRVLNSIRGVLVVLDRFDTNAEEFGGRSPVDYLQNNPTRIGLGNIARQVPGVGGLLNEFISPGRTGMPGEVGQRILPGAEMTRLQNTPEGRAMQTLMTLGKGFLAQLARGSSEVGNLNTFEQINMRDAYIPNPETDNPASARQKLQEARVMFRSFERALQSGQLTGEQIMRILTRGAEVDYDELVRRGQAPGRGTAIEGPIGAGVAR